MKKTIKFKKEYSTATDKRRNRCPTCDIEMDYIGLVCLEQEGALRQCPNCKKVVLD